MAGSPTRRGAHAPAPYHPALQPGADRDEEGIRLEVLAEVAGARLSGDGSVRIRQVAPLESAGPDQISFLANSRYRRFLAGTRAGAVVLSEADRQGTERPALISANPYLAFARIARYLNPPRVERPGVHPSATVHPRATLAGDVVVGPQAVIGAGARLSAGVVIGAGAVVGEEVSIGEGSRLAPRVTVYDRCVIGRRALIHAGTVIGADGFGFANDRGRWEKVPQLGRVVIGDDVEIGANCAVDRGALGDTVIEDGVKIDNLVQIAHNVHIGAHTIMAGTAAVAGSSRLGRHCMVAGGAGIAGHLEIADGTVITARAVVTHDLREPGSYSSGTQLAPTRQWRKNAVRFQQLDEMARRLRELEREVAQLTHGETGGDGRA